MIVASLEEARAALAAGATMLESPPGAAGHHGIGWWREVLAVLAAEFGRFDSVLDCGPFPGLALAAIRDGIPCIRVDAAPETVAKIRAIADQAGVRVVQ